MRDDRKNILLEYEVVPLPQLTNTNANIILQEFINPVSAGIP
jgi:hypothetical protein